MPPAKTPTVTASDRASLLICFSHLRWNFVYQRPQHLMTRAARTHGLLFFEEPVFETGIKPRLDLSAAKGGVTVATPVLPERLSPEMIAAAQRALLDRHLAGESGRNLIFWHYTPMALAFNDHLRPDLRIYDCMDELSAFKDAPPQLMQLERRLFEKVDLVFTGGQSLFEAKRHRHPSVHAFPSSIDAGHFRRARTHARPEPADQAGIPQPRLGFFGVIDERMDLELVARMAALRPDWQFVMLGPVVKIDPATLPQRPNVHWLGGKSYQELPDYLAGWRLGLMPFALNESTRFISPTKTPEFLAAGLPVVSTAITDVVRPYGASGLVSIAADAGEMVARAEEWMAGADRAGWLAAVDRFLSGVSWDKTWSAMHGLMMEARMNKETSTVASGLAGAPAGSGLRV
ncbi:MAG: glycosyltransferase [Rhodospirillales bacterium]|jgi:glycosyltransferase involved in cell wall biosynthesis|nr:glycosyltransferase [Rhodospirillales bacterium]